MNKMMAKIMFIIRGLIRIVYVVMFISGVALALGILLELPVALNFVNKLPNLLPLPSQLLPYSLPILLIGISIVIAIIEAILTKAFKIDSYCRKCGASLLGCAYSGNVAYVKKGNYTDSNGVRYIREYSKVIIEFTCPDCGKVRKHKFSILSYDQKSGKTTNVQYEIEKYCKKRFGH